MSLDILLHRTPPWVWALFAVLVYRGIRALRPRRMSVARTFLLPILFLVWVLVSIHSEVTDLQSAYEAFVAGAAAGGVIGWMLWARAGRATYYPDTQMIERPGSPLTLVLLILAFLSKFALMAMLAQDHGLAANAAFSAAFGGVSGLVDGMFWGGTLSQVWHLRHLALGMPVAPVIVDAPGPDDRR